MPCRFENASTVFGSWYGPVHEKMLSESSSLVPVGPRRAPDGLPLSHPLTPSATAALPAGERARPLGHKRVHLHGHGPDVVGHAGDLGRLPCVVEGELPGTDDVGEDVARQQAHALGDDTDLPAHGADVEGVEVLAVV